ncbi:Lrp/AsnC family transcriptional regulator [Paremcibacter congregatus]|uniref:Lrp/AsnC family transcriptional regulator n=1 Tax=Paremcibacter congregatus TaxID=2043170 RepID=UPI0030EF10A8|tara:strand:- start:826 stop:1293 length:468 start_codon:yes stop_codon:yes gene_type:complete
MNFDKTDLAILDLMQKDISISIDELARRVGLTKTPCWRRVQKLEKSGVIKGRVALLDGDMLDRKVSVFVQVKTSQHNRAWLENFSRTVCDFPEVASFYRMSGEYDYLLRVIVRDIAAYDDFYRRFIEATSLTDVTSNFAMEEIKNSTEIFLGNMI